MKLEFLLAAAGCRQMPDARVLSLDIRGLEYDSRRIEPGWLFFAFQGARADGREFAMQAMERGAAAVVSEQPPPAGFAGPWIEVEHGRRAMALMARTFYAEAAAAVKIIGVTGTNGKTTTTFLIDHLLRHCGHTTALIGTISYHVAGATRDAVNTTPESVDIYRAITSLHDAGGEHLIMEISSHALALGRVHGFRFHTAVFTNFTRDHLDFHGTMETYFDAKAELFRGQAAEPPCAAVLNADDQATGKLPIASATRTIRYGLSAAAPLRAVNLKTSFTGLRFDLRWESRSWPVESPLVGRMNVYNLLAAIGAGLTCGLDPAKLVEGIREFSAVPGRFERVDEGQPFLAIVDYAHTEDALRNAISAARELTSHRVLTVFGCGGDRDRTKRPLMGQAAGELSDYVVLTSDNPRSEDPIAIMTDALVGLRRTDTPHVAEPDRTRAIRRALTEAGPDDVVLIAGKGHETYQVLKDRTIPFDDREVARQVLREFGFGRHHETRR
jgi:UDP-N-acetylmuramoyl-L-alanyl-D-glutamate--2,6-diaminopimelate ligase